MKHIVWGIAAVFAAVMVTVIVMTIGGRDIRETRLERALADACDEAVKQLMLEGDYPIISDDEFTADFISRLVTSLDSGNDPNHKLTVSVAGVDREKGLLSVKVDEEFTHPNGRIGTCTAKRTVIFEREQMKKTHTVSYYLSPDYVEYAKLPEQFDSSEYLYKRFEQEEDTNILTPESPTGDDEDVEWYCVGTSEPAIIPIKAKYSPETLRSMPCNGDYSFRSDISKSDRTVKFWIDSDRSVTLALVPFMADILDYAPEAGKEGYEFVGWRSDYNASDEVIREGEMIADRSGKNLYAVFRRTNEYRAVFLGNGASEGSVPDIVTRLTEYYNNGSQRYFDGERSAWQDTAGVSITLPENGYLREGFNFVGWDNDGRTYKAGYTPFIISAPATETFFARWSVDKVLNNGEYCDFDLTGFKDVTFTVAVMPPYGNWCAIVGFYPIYEDGTVGSEPIADFAGYYYPPLPVNDARRYIYDPFGGYYTGDVSLNSGSGTKTFDVSDYKGIRVKVRYSMIHIPYSGGGYGNMQVRITMK